MEVVHFKILLALAIFFIQMVRGIHLNLMHINDFQGHFSPTNSLSKECSPEEIEVHNCFGGFARLKSKVEDIQKSFEDTIFLNIGDFAQDSIWFTIYGWDAIGHFFNMINQTAMVLGGHEFDFGPEGVKSLLNAIKFPLICSNLDATKVPEIQRSINKSIITIIDGQKVGIIGYIAAATKVSSNPGPLNFSDEVESVKTEAIRLHEIENVRIIIAAGHSGLPVDYNIAELPYVDIVVGGRSHTFLYSGTAPSTDDAEGKYPIKITKKDGSISLIVHAGSLGKYLGLLHVIFDDDGKVISWDGNPILLDSTIKEDEHVLTEIGVWRKKAKDFVSQEVGQTKVFMDGRISVCRRRECNMGNILTDSYVFLGLKYTDSNKDSWNYVAVSFANSGGIRGSIDERSTQGVITRDSAYRILPFKNQIYFAEITGHTLRTALEFSVSELTDPKVQFPDGRFLQMSGVKMTIDLCGLQSLRVKDISVLCSDCQIPRYYPLQNESYYRIVIPDYLVSSQAFGVIANNLLNLEPTGIADSDALIEYLKARGPVITGTERRIIILGEDGCNMNKAGIVKIPMRIVSLLIILCLIY